jgi:hypothetical protein
MNNAAVTDLSSMRFGITTAQVQVNAQLIKDVLRTDSEFFIQFFLGDELTFPVPEFHKTIFNKMTDTAIDKFVCAIPRDHAKTTLAKLAVIWYFLFTNYRFIIYLSNTATIAQAACQDIVAFMEGENFRSVFGDIDWEIRREGDGIYKFNLTLTDKEGRSYTKRCILRALGAGQQVRGINIDNQRPQLAVVDDLEDNDNIATEILFDKLKKWFYGPFKKCLDKFHNKIIHLGNMISNKCLLREHCESQFWHSMRFGCLLSDGTPLWPDAWPLDKLREDFLEYLNNGLLDVWFAEMMNQPMAAGRGLIRADQIEYRHKLFPDDIEYGFMTVDVAISNKTWGHKTSIAVHGFYEKKWQLVDSFLEQAVDPIKLFEKIYELACLWHIQVVGIETIGYQAALKFVFDYLMMERGIEGLEFVELSNTERKVQRLAGWCAFLKNKSYVLTNGDLATTDQLLSFDPIKKTNDDDLIDAAAYSVEMIDDYIVLIVSQHGLAALTKPKDSVDICEV